MKIAIPTLGENVNQHFGRSENFTIFDAEEGKIVGKEIISAAGFHHQHGYLAGLLNSAGATVVITDGINQGAISALKDFGFEVLTGATGEAQTVAELYAIGEFTLANTIYGRHYDYHISDEFVH